MKRSIYASATLTLTGWYLLIVMAISISFSTVVYRFAVDELSHGLTSQSQRIYQAFPVFDNDPFFKRDTDLSRAKHHILIELIGFNVVVLVVAGFASFWLARRTLRPIEDSNERQRRFTADVSHELRTPLTALKMSSEVALMDPKASKEELRQALEAVVEESAKLDRLTSNLLRLSQLEISDFQGSFTVFELDDLLQAAIGEVRQRATTKHLTINLQPTGLQVVGDEASLHELFVILLDNAVKYSAKNGQIDISAAARDRQVTVSIADHGSGIEAEALQHVFDRFYRADPSRTHSATHGYGLGLAIAKQIADMHEATITLSSRPGQGTTAVILLAAPVGPAT
jgi:signal transduction histidine kinase